MRSRAVFHTVVMWLVVLAILASCSVLWGEIQLKPQYADHEPIVATVSVPGMPEGAVLRKAKFKCPGASIVKVDESTFHIWAAPGKYTIEATGTWRLYQTIIDKQDKEWKVIADEDDYEFTIDFTVGGPGPNPPPPPPPGTRWAVIWEETEQRTPADGNLYLSLRKQFQDAKLQIKDVTNLPPNLRALESQRPTNLPLPVLMVIARQTDGTDKVIRTVPRPSSVSGVVEELAK